MDLVSARHETQVRAVWHDVIGISSGHGLAGVGLPKDHVEILPVFGCTQFATNSLPLESAASATRIWNEFAVARRGRGLNPPLCWCGSDRPGIIADTPFIARQREQKAAVRSSEDRGRNYSFHVARETHRLPRISAISRQCYLNALLPHHRKCQSEGARRPVAC